MLCFNANEAVLKDFGNIDHNNTTTKYKKYITFLCTLMIIVLKWKHNTCNLPDVTIVPWFTRYHYELNTDEPSSIEYDIFAGR